ncbi:SDR family NAD(P)-dependent oxidoreductase [Nocardia panacis]|uniref:SDR family NAD(P)-dependent oxidoreductase n=1 Tax=Nocardia panacis TaxID=2340916 RepID=A0A3A4JZL8_9NOCA|nr:type I polyketide synthase [Nocardia panacis]RJO76915.1 SDR family NAD(P)-dependent oxidoreductase [Nocardia panacis]
MNAPPHASNPPVSIIGIGCRLPGATGATELWELLSAGRPVIGDPPAGRIGRPGGYRTDLEWFDNEWFGIGQREAAGMDPGHRLALEVAVEALDDAGIGHRAPGSGAAVIFGGTEETHLPDGPANRLSRALDLRGPNFMVDSARTSSLAAVELAVRILADPGVPFAIVGGVTLIPHTAPEHGPCGEGGAAIILCRTADAHRDGHRGYAEIAAIAMGSDGRADGPTAPGGRHVIRTALARAALPPSAIDYLEYHGGGPHSADTAELDALAAVFTPLSTAPLRLGCTHTTFGHLEAMAGITGLIKAALAVHHAVIPPNPPPHSTNPVFRQPAVPTPWPTPHRHAAVNSCTPGGTIVHAILRALPDPTVRPASPPYLIPFTAHTLPELRTTAAHLADHFARCDGAAPAERATASAHRRAPDIAHPDSARPSTDLAIATQDRRPAEPSSLRHPTSGGAQPEDQVLRPERRGEIPSAGSPAATALPARYGARPEPTTIGVGAAGTEFGSDETEFQGAVAAVGRLVPEGVRAVVLAEDRGEAIARLRRFAEGDDRAVVAGPVAGIRRGGVVFVFSGEGAQYARMGRGLAARWPVFAEAVTEAAAAIVAGGGPRVWTPRHGFALGAGVTPEFAQPAVFAYQFGLAALLRAWGVRPDAVVGYGLGEVAAATVGGALTLRDAARVAVWRGRILARLAGSGAAAVLAAPVRRVRTLVEPLRAEVGIAAVHGADAVVVAGSPRYLDALLRRAERRDIRVARLAPDRVRHGLRVAPLLPELVAALSDLAPTEPHTAVYSPTRQGNPLMDARFWADNLTGTVEFDRAMGDLVANGFSTALEISPRPLLLESLRAYPELRDAAYPTADADDESAALLTGLARLHAEGYPLDWTAQGPLTAAAPRRHWNRRRFPLPAATEHIEISWAAEDLTDHVILGAPAVPAVFWLRRLLELTRTGNPPATAVADFVVHERLAPGALPGVNYHRHADGSVRAEATGTGALASTRPAGGPTPADIVAWMRLVDGNRAGHHRMRGIAPDTFYDALRLRHLEYGPRFRPLRAIAVGRDGGADGFGAVGFFDAAPLHSAATLDGCLQLLAAAAYDELPTDGVPLPIVIESAWVSDASDRVLLEAHAFVRQRTATGLRGDVIATDQHGAPAVALLGVHVRYARLGAGRTIDIALPPVVPASEVPLRQEIWRPVELRPPPARAERALVIGASPEAIRLAEALDRLAPTERVVREPDTAAAMVASLLADHPATAVVVVWPHRRTAHVPDAIAPSDEIATVTAVLELLRTIHSATATGAVTVVLPAAALDPHGGGSAVPMALAGLIRSLQLETSRPIRLVWDDHHRDSVRHIAEIATATPDSATPSSRGATKDTPPEEVRLTAGSGSARRFTAVRPRSTTPIAIDPHGTYVVTGGLGAFGAMTVRWLLDAGARDVVVLTRAPRPLPALLDGMEERIVVMRCDAADRGDLGYALNDIRETCSTIRGIVHAAGTPDDAPFAELTPQRLAAAFAPKLTAARNLIDLTARDAIDFILLYSAAVGATGAPGRAASAAANAAMDALALAHPDRPVHSIGWSGWAVTEQAHRAGDLLTQILRYPGPYLLVLDAPPDDPRLSTRLADLLAGEIPAPEAGTDLASRPVRQPNHPARSIGEQRANSS